MHANVLLGLEQKRLRAMKDRMKDESYLTVLDVAKRWGVSRSLVEGLPTEVLPYINITPHSKRAHRRYHPGEVSAAEVRLRHWEAAKGNGAGEQYLRDLRGNLAAKDEALLAMAQEAIAA